MQAANLHGNVRGCRLAVSDPRFPAQTPVTDRGLATTLFRDGPEGLASGFWPSLGLLPAFGLPGPHNLAPSSSWDSPLHMQLHSRGFLRAPPLIVIVWRHKCQTTVILEANRSRRFRDRLGTPSWLTSMPCPVLDGEHRWFQDGYLEDGLGGEGPVDIRHTPMMPLFSAEAGMADSCPGPWMEPGSVPAAAGHIPSFCFTTGAFSSICNLGPAAGVMFSFLATTPHPSFPLDSPIFPRPDHWVFFALDLVSFLSPAQVEPHHNLTRAMASYSASAAATHAYMLAA